MSKNNIVYVGARSRPVIAQCLDFLASRLVRTLCDEDWPDRYIPDDAIYLVETSPDARLPSGFLRIAPANMDRRTREATERKFISPEHTQVLTLSNLVFVKPSGIGTGAYTDRKSIIRLQHALCDLAKIPFNEHRQPKPARHHNRVAEDFGGGLQPYLC